MPVGTPRSWPLSRVVLGLTGAAVLVACTVGEATTKKKRRTPIDPGEDFYGDDVPSAMSPIEPDQVNDNSGVFGASERPTDGGPNVVRPDAGPAAPDAGPLRNYCAGELEAGDLAVVELMITSKTGSGDSGEWVEVQSTRSCWLKLEGVSVESPRGALPSNIATFTEPFDLAPNAMFVVAASSDPLKNHGITGKVIAWEATDVLKNDGDELVVKRGDVEIDRLTYPGFNNLTTGRAVSFPADCAWSQRSDWTRWSLTFDEFAPGLKGTPNADNFDVACY